MLYTQLCKHFPGLKCKATFWNSMWQLSFRNVLVRTWKWQNITEVSNKRAACGPFDVFERPMSTSKYNKFYLKLWFKTHFCFDRWPQRHFSPNIMQPLFFVKMWPLHRSEFEMYRRLSFKVFRRVYKTSCHFR